MYKNVLLIQLRQLGDILLTTPCIREIKRSIPDAKITFLCHRMGGVIVNENPYLDECFIYDEKRNSLKDYFKLVRSIRQKRFDLVIDFMNNPRSAFFSLLSGCDTRVAFRSKRRFFYTQLVDKARPSDYIVKEKFRLLEAAEIPARDTSLTLPWFEIHTSPLLKFYSQYPEFKESGLRIVLSPTHRRDVRRWPVENFAKLADYLVRDLDAFVSWIWGPGEEAEIDSVMRFCKQKTHKTPPTTFREMAAIIANHDLFIGNSNGPSHVAVANQIFSLQLHGPTSAKAWSPNDAKHIALQAPGGVMSNLTVDQVIQRLQSFLPAVIADRQAQNYNTIRLKWN